jgi:hypothetical protein
VLFSSRQAQHTKTRKKKRHFSHGRTRTVASYQLSVDRLAADLWLRPLGYRYCLPVTYWNNLKKAVFYICRRTVLHALFNAYNLYRQSFTMSLVCRCKERKQKNAPRAVLKPPGATHENTKKNVLATDGTDRHRQKQKNAPRTHENTKEEKDFSHRHTQTKK